MAAASYTTDLTLIHACDAASASWTEPTGFADGAITLPETDYFIQNTGCLSKNMGAGASAVSGAIYNLGSGATIPSGSAVFVWLFFGAPNALATQANGGLRVFVGSGTAAFKQWYVRGSNTYTYGGWFCVPVDPNTTQDATSGSPTATLQYFGAAAVLSGASAVSKGNPLGIDILRYGRGEMRINGGDLANGYATFAGFATQNDSLTNRWGLFQAIDGGYLWQGLMTLGYTSAVDFRDSNVNIQVANTQKVAAAFNRIEVRQASSRIDWTGVNITALGTTSKGQFEMIDAADVNIESCSFTDMDTLVFLSTATVNSTIFRRCARVTVGGGVFDKCTFDKSTATSAVLASSPANAALITNTSFISDGTGHAIEITGTAANFTLTGNTYSGYATSDGSTGNEAVYVNIATGSLNLTVSGGSTPTIRTAGAVVTVISGAVTVLAKAVTEAGAAISGAKVHLEADTGGPFPSGATVTITNSGTTATVTHTAHGMATNDKVAIRGASHLQNIGVFTITKINNDSYSYTMASAPGSNPTGTITSTFVVLNGDTNVSGEISMSRVFPSNQPVKGQIRKSSSAPYYKQATLTGTVSSTTGATLTGVMISDA